ncbi:MAG: glycosyltransferase [Sulfobacillus sp.]
MPRKLMFLSDAVSCFSGLGRITRDLATRVHRDLSDVFEVASVGYGGPGSVSIPFYEYHLHDVNQWLAPELPAIWNDFVGDEEGILMVCWDASRLYWLGMPQTCPVPHLRHWVEEGRKSGKLKLWLYHAVDAEGPQGRFPLRLTETLKGFDRVLDYSEFSSRITGNPDHLPHGIDTTVFFPRDHREARRRFIERGFQGLKQDSLLVGIVATNQARKNWQLGMETVRILLDRGHDVRLWAHTDVLQRHWDIGSMVADYGLAGRVAITNQRFTDEELSWMYSGCDVTLSNAPEGFGFSSGEALACGVPTIASSYAAQAEFVPKDMQVDPIAYYYEGAFCSKRPVFTPSEWADRVIYCIGKYGGHERKSLLPSFVDWSGPTLWASWEKWFRRGIE